MGRKIKIKIKINVKSRSRSRSHNILTPVGASLLAIAVVRSTLLYLTHRHREQAHSHSGLMYTCKKSVGYQAAFAGKPRSYKKQAEQRTALALHHSSGRALARLQLLILIHPPLSGG
ncbi:hypothetical protein [Pseudomonas sp. LB1P83]